MAAKLNPMITAMIDEFETRAVALLECDRALRSLARAFGQHRRFQPLRLYHPTKSYELDRKLGAPPPASGAWGRLGTVYERTGSRAADGDDASGSGARTSGMLAARLIGSPRRRAIGSMPAS